MLGPTVEWHAAVRIQCRHSQQQSPATAICIVLSVVSVLTKRIAASGVLCFCCSPVRVINVASIAHVFGRINFDDLMSSRFYHPWVAYGERY